MFFQKQYNFFHQIFMIKNIHEEITYFWLAEDECILV